MLHDVTGDTVTIKQINILATARTDPGPNASN